MILLLLALLCQADAEWRAVLEKSKDPSARGDAHFKLGEFPKAVAEYEKMVELDPSIEKSHWRRGIAYFYAGQYDKAAHQFEIYDTFDNVDRENGIWRYFSQLKAHGKEKAQKGLLKYEKDDREPFPDVYQLFEGKRTPDQILEKIKAAEISDEARESRYFYAHLYIGLNFAVEGKKVDAIPHLRKATANTWGPKAGFGPNYMWHVGRLHYDLLAAKKD
jgi:lipoprotein NlpI